MSLYTTIDNLIKILSKEYKMHIFGRKYFALNIVLWKSTELKMDLYKLCTFLFRVTAMMHLFSRCSHILYSGKNPLYFIKLQEIIMFNLIVEID